MLKKVAICLCALATATSILGINPAQTEGGRKLGVDLETAIASQYLWRGYDVLGSHGAFQPSVTFDMFQTGLSLNIWGSFAFDNDYEDADELDYTVACGGVLFEQERYAIEYSVNYIYYDFPSVNSQEADSQEIGFGISIPNLLPIGSSSLVPSYYCGYLWEVYDRGPEDGLFNILGVGYDLPIPAILPRQEEQALSVAADITHNDGAFGSDSDWSHATMTVSTSFEFKGFTLTPSAAYQWSFEDTVNDEDELWATLTMGYSF